MHRARPGGCWRLTHTLRRCAAMLLACGALGAAAPRAGAEPSVPWMPSPAARHALQLLVDDAGLELPATQWPLPSGAVASALDALPASLPPAHDAAREQLRRELAAQRHVRAAASLRTRADALVGFGDDATPGSAFALRSAVGGGKALALQLGVRAEAHADADHGGWQGRLDDSAAVVEAGGLLLQATAHRNWWGPGWQSALALGNNAPAYVALGLQRASASRSASPWLAWLGPWNFDVFIARTEDGGAFSSRPFLIGNRLTLRPWSAVEIGVTRVAQWGGKGRPESWHSFVDMLFGANVNVDGDAMAAIDAANSVAGFDLRLRCPTGLRCALYGQWMGEDEAGHLPSKYLTLWGAELWSADGTQRGWLEYTETSCHHSLVHGGQKNCAYRNHAYPQGYTSAERWIGASVGADSRLVTLGWLNDRGASLRLHTGRVGSRIGTGSPLVDDPATSGRLHGVSARYAFAWRRNVAVVPELDWVRVRAPLGPRTEARIGATLAVSLDGTR